MWHGDGDMATLEINDGKYLMFDDDPYTFWALRSSSQKSKNLITIEFETTILFKSIEMFIRHSDQG